MPIPSHRVPQASTVVAIDFWLVHVWFLSHRGPMEWNGVRHHHMDALQLSDGSWLAVMDGDSVISGHISRGILSRLGIAASLIALGLCLWCSHERCMACARSRAGRLCCLPLFVRPLQLQWLRLKAKSSGSAIDPSGCTNPSTAISPALAPSCCD